MPQIIAVDFDPLDGTPGAKPTHNPTPKNVNGASKSQKLKKQVNRSSNITPYIEIELDCHRVRGWTGGPCMHHRLIQSYWPLLYASKANSCG